MKGFSYVCCVPLILLALCMPALAGSNVEIIDGPTGLTIEVPSASSGGPIHGSSDFISRLYNGVEQITIISSHDLMEIELEGVTFSLFRGPGGDAQGVYIDGGHREGTYLLTSPTLLTALPTEMELIVGPRSSGFMQDCADLLYDQVQLDLQGPRTVATTFRAFLEAIFYMGYAATTVTRADVDHLINTWEAVNLAMVPNPSSEK